LAAIQVRNSPSSLKRRDRSLLKPHRQGDNGARIDGAETGEAEEPPQGAP
jgi:hypothetical protein